MTPRELAAAIRKGHTMIGEGNNFMPSDFNGNCGCALSAAWFGIGKHKKEFFKHIKYDNIPSTFSERMNFPEILATEINDRHCGGMSRLAIADWLDTLEPETKPADKQTFDEFMQAVMLPVAVEPKCDVR